MEKKSQKSSKSEDTDERIVVNVDGEQFFSFSPMKIKKNVAKLVKNVQRGNYCNDNPNLPIDEAIARFERLPAAQKRNYGIHPTDSLELFIRVLNDVCGKEHLPPIGPGLQCHFTIKDLIIGHADALTFIETLTNQVALQLHKKMPADLVQNVPLFRQENDPTYVWRPQTIFLHSEGYN
ncbi:MAG: hypothetical protein GY816_07525, partial [Cytophagales bacterium]|nr:hypothetical protein [Cytophagales bacterium]